ncbi:MAG: hypothetical protein R3342_11530 [Lutibacter sp.]|uniref:hypothetical protein n=1 Tax=Lutibacter sp. TaxID=1925666 RepID=UPI00299E6EB6|nr:hypothetical protein [Lutibacter sp.]MDX1830163.1 hypothetical protein [Lutibacter sp.]
MKNITKLLVLFISVFTLLSCNNSKEKYSKVKKSKVQKVSNTHKIVLDDFIDANDYTYIKVTEKGKTYWMAITKMPVKKGETYYYDDGMVMKNFKSKSLNKTFESIIFLDKIRTTMEPQIKNVESPHANSPKKKDKIKIAKIEQPVGGTSLEQLLSNKESFAGKTILIKGKVLKVNNAIMDRNWVHIADGTGFKDIIDLGITTLDTVKVGDVVTFKGKIALNKDFGYGYIYPILMEKATLIK